MFMSTMAENITDRDDPEEGVFAEMYASVCESAYPQVRGRGTPSPLFASHSMASRPASASSCFMHVHLFVPLLLLVPVRLFSSLVRFSSSNYSSWSSFCPIVISLPFSSMSFFDHSSAVCLLASRFQPQRHQPRAAPHLCRAATSRTR